MSYNPEAHTDCVTVIGLTTGNLYHIRVAAVNSAGRGQFTQTNEPIQAQSAPSSLSH